jgi:hypothetical protein
MKTKHGDFEKRVTFKVWSDYKVYIVFTDDLAASRISRYETAGVAGESGTAALFTRGAGGYGHLFFLKDACARIITHECVHAIWALFDWSGVKQWDNETLAYHLGYLVGEVSEFQAKVLRESNPNAARGKHEERRRSTGRPRP